MLPNNLENSRQMCYSRLLHLFLRANVWPDAHWKSAMQRQTICQLIDNDDISDLKLHTDLYLHGIHLPIYGNSQAHFISSFCGFKGMQLRILSILSCLYTVGLWHVVHTIIKMHTNELCGNYPSIVNDDVWYIIITLYLYSAYHGTLCASQHTRCYHFLTQDPPVKVTLITNPVVSRLLQNC